MGATAGKDGASVMSWPSNISCTPVEVAERDSPVFFRYKALRPDSGGAGRFRGGLGEEICFVSRHPTPLNIVFLTERIQVPAPGVGGGESGACGEVLIDGQVIDTRRPHVLQPGAEVILRTPGGGGYGPASERGEAAVAHDVEHGYTTAKRRAQVRTTPAAGAISLTS
jgi:N-methylhydantoinase B